MVFVEASYRFAPGKREEFCRAVAREGILEATHKEQGNLRYALFCPLGDEEGLILLERWEDEEALERHFATPHFKRMMELEKELVSASEFQRYSAE